MICAATLSGCGSQQNQPDGGEPAGDQQAAAKGKILVYISGSEQMVNTLETKFEEKHGDVLDVFHTGCGPLGQKVWMEMEIGNISGKTVPWQCDELYG
ncbi:MAG: hypothetical protein U9N81_09435 [Bacillota bacterium]|nr:hypothetical protein [Bacillota bacterium]